MKVLATVAEALAQSHARLPRVLVPTMGALHKAHLELIRVARDCAGGGGEVAVSIFVNPAVRAGKRLSTVSATRPAG